MNPIPVSWQNHDETPTPCDRASSGRLRACKPVGDARAGDLILSMTVHRRLYQTDKENRK
jgi:hypothetical protein